MKGPAKSTAVRIKALKDDCSLHKGRGAITFLAYFALFLKQAAHSFSRISSLAAMIQYFSDNADRVWLVPALCFPSS